MIQSLIVIDPKAEITANQDVNTLVLHPVDGKEIGIQDVRRLNRWVGQTSFASGLKRGVILQANRLSRDAQQALLKTLEEPADNTQIILTVDQADRLIPTIQSRCAVIDPQVDGDRLLSDLMLMRNQSGEAVDPSITFNDFQSKSELERWKALEKIVSQKGSLAAHLLSWQDELLDQLRLCDGTKTAIIQQLELIDQSKSALQSNVAPKLVADRLLLLLRA